MTLRIYLDNNASTSLDPEITDLLIQTIQILGGNPSSSHSAGQKIRNLISKARSSIAAFLQVKSNEILFTSGGTESANMILRGIAAQKKQGHLITSTVEHSCVFSMAKQLEKDGLNISFLQPGTWGAVSPNALLKAIRPDTCLIALMAVNNETGVKTDIEAIAAIAKEHKIPFFVDGVALLGKEVFSIPSGVTAMSFSAHKVHALQGTGFVFIRSGLKLQPFLIGGEHEFGKRAGTENVLGIIALSKAIELLETKVASASQHMRILRDQFENLLLSNLPNVFINGQGPRVSNVSNLAFSGVEGETLLMMLDQAGVLASHGSACASGALEPSRILLNMGLPTDLVHSSIRFSLSRFTTEQEINEAASIIIRLVKRLRKN